MQTAFDLVNKDTKQPAEPLGPKTTGVANTVREEEISTLTVT